MPGLSGPQLAALIGKLELSPMPAIVLWSALDDQSLRRAGEEAGGLPTISKSMRPSAVALQLEALAARRARSGRQP
jgi:hypothetical protein